MNKRQNIKKIKMCVEAEPGSHLDDCLRESILLCLELGAKVELTHNETYYLSDPTVIINFVEQHKKSFHF